MEHIVIILTPLEMLLVNLYVIHKCSQRKYSRTTTFMSMGLFTLGLMLFTYSFLRTVPNFGNGNGLFVFGGFLFVIPIKLLYRVPGAKIVTIACFSWTYTFTLFALSVRFSYAFAAQGWNIHITGLLLQTILYIATFKTFNNVLMARFIYILEHTGKKESSALMWMTMMWFWTVLIFILSFTYPNTGWLQLIAFPTLALCIISNFRYVYLRINSNATIQDLENIAYRDELTQLRTRVVLSKDAESLIMRKLPFTLIFFDLNNFKSINDRYGHNVGDKYLAFFAYEIKTRIGNRGGFYRIAGDEFACILPEEGLDSFLEAISTLPSMMTDSQVEFLGFSHGIANYPQDGATIEDLLESADQHMYEMKRARKQ